MVQWCSLQPAASDKAFETLAVATDPHGPVLSLTAYGPCLEAVLVILDRHSKVCRTPCRIGMCTATSACVHISA